MDGEMVAVRTVNKVDQLHISSKNGSGGDGTTSDENDVVQSYYRYGYVVVYAFVIVLFYPRCVVLVLGMWTVMCICAVAVFVLDI